MEGDLGRLIYFLISPLKWMTQVESVVCCEDEERLEPTVALWVYQQVACQRRCDKQRYLCEELFSEQSDNQSQCVLFLHGKQDYEQERQRKHYHTIVLVKFFSNTEITEKLSYPVKISSSSGEKTIFCFCGRTRDCRLLFRRPGDWFRAKEGNESGGRASVRSITCPIRVIKGLKRKWTFAKIYSKSWSTT